MTITEEIIAAYIEGNVSDAERKEVRRYLAMHPETQDLVLALIDDSNGIEFEAEKMAKKPSPLKQSYSEIAYASAAFAPQLKIEPPKNEGQIDLIDKRRKRLSSFWDELNLE